MKILLAVAGILAGWWVARRLGRSPASAPPRAATSLFFDAFLVGALSARLAYIVRWWDEYAAAPWSMLTVGDGGFVWWVGAPMAIAFIAWRARRARSTGIAAGAGVTAALCVWLMLSGVHGLLLRSAPPLPELTLVDVSGQPVSLRDHAGAPVVVNLWATWCPPCRREMPAFHAAQARHPEVTFLMVNQGESAADAEAFLRNSGLHFPHVLLDSSSSTMQALNTRALPTTAMFDHDGRLLDIHLGEMTRAGLEGKLQRYFPSHSRSTTTSKESK
ncbi:TlpA disulfide reductase family protein [Stenotrophomonas lactitubi]|jgi:thiol-disulfide isomerase/thioredoxin|uniref:TlpA disulfide reductase family protein n=1 Tax=Stenotrophomonas TaxID=40323 RepID=UPI00131262F9|nr:TlpA disulfide reductase family protein [Stenotrophomonas lactitubi]MCX2894541.1 TlpA disulfide reductase family protein [Stenotrophomonas lactitubi]